MPLLLGAVFIRERQVGVVVKKFGARSLPPGLKRLFEWQGATFQADFHRLATHQLHDEASPAVDFFETVDVSNVRMIQGSKNLGLALES